MSRVDPARRRFLKLVAATPIGAVAAAQAAPGLALASPKPSSDKTLATLLDLDKCIGCGVCVQACREANAAKYPKPEKPFPAMFPERVKVEDWSEKQGVETRLTPYNWLFIQEAKGEFEGRPFAVNIPRRCLHCENPPCARLCPWGAAGREDNGAVRIDPAACLGGAKCRQVCPWGIPQRQTGVGLYLDLLPRFAGNGVMFKCDRCYERVQAGGVPSCVEVCPNSVQEIGPRDAIIRKAKESGRFVYGLTENGGTNTLYVSSVPFAVLSAALKTGPGVPHLKPVADPFADQAVLAQAMVMGPVAAAAGVAVRAMRAGAGQSKGIAAPLAVSGAGWAKGLWIALLALLGLTGVAQMPIFKRYYIADIPGLSWLDDFFLTHRLHYLLAVGFVAWGVWKVGRWRKDARPGLTANGLLRVGFLVGLVLTGAFRVYKNQAGLTLSPLAAQVVDIGHLALAFGFGLFALWAFLKKRTYLRPDGSETKS